MTLTRTFTILFAIAIAAGLLATLAGCDQAPPPPPLKAQGATTEYDFNGTIEGCRLYHVRPEHGENFQTVICDHADATTSWTVSHGKTHSTETSRTVRK